MQFKGLNRISLVFCIRMTWLFIITAVLGIFLVYVTGRTSLNLQLKWRNAGSPGMCTIIVPLTKPTVKEDKKGECLKYPGNFLFY